MVTKPTDSEHMTAVADSEAIAQATQVIDDSPAETTWFWRRLFSFLVSGGILYILWSNGERLTGVSLLLFAQGLMILLGIVIFLYVAGASVDQATRILAAVKVVTKVKDSKP